jgi:hypothetical protein
MWVQLGDVRRQLLLRDTRTDLTAPKGRLRRPAADDSRGRELEPAVAPQNGKRPRAAAATGLIAVSGDQPPAKVSQELGRPLSYPVRTQR